MSKKRKHILIWCLLLIYFYFFNGMECDSLTMIVFATLFGFEFIATYYFTQIFIFQIAIKENHILTILGFIAAYVIFAILELTNFKLIFPLVNIKTPRDELNTLEFLSYSLFWYVFLFVFAYSHILQKLSIVRVKQTIYNSENRIRSESSMLKSQFHSHLNFNFLSFCYAKMLEFEESKSEIVNFYADMLHYSLCASKFKRININEEINYLQNFIALQSYLTEDIEHSFNVEIDNNNYIISPLLLGVLVEQAYKHGKLNSKTNPIRIELHIRNSKLHFTINYFKESIQNIFFDNQIYHSLVQFLNLNYPNLNYVNQIIKEDLITLELQLSLDEKN